MERIERHVDLTGMRFSKILIIKAVKTKRGGIPTQWLCSCDCGKEFTCSDSELRKHQRKSCGCHHFEWKRSDFRGQVFGRLTVVEYAPNDKKNRTCYICICECGKTKIISHSMLKVGDAKSCGCLRDEYMGKGAINRKWKGGVKKEGGGYISIYKPDHPNATVVGYVREHIDVMSEFIGRPLYKNETVHHKNGIRDDNRMENLELWCNGHPFGQRVSDMIIHAKEILEKYDPTALSYTTKKEERQ